MKKNILNASFYILILGVFALSSTGCGKKSVTTPEAGSANQSGTTIDYPPADAYSENNVPVEGSLDDTTGQTIGNLSINSQQDGQQSDVYKRNYGRSSIQLKPIFFAFDQAGIRGDMVDIMVSNADYLLAKPSVSIVVEGNCDDRGTNEYNLALGERRAINAKEYLVDLGVGENRIRTVSYGEERPLFPGQAEASLEMNRRDDFILE